MKTIRFAAFLFYRYYSNGRAMYLGKDSYNNTIIALTVIAILNLILVLFVLQGWYSTFFSAFFFNINYFTLAMFFVSIVLYFLLAKVIKEDSLRQLNYPAEKISRGNKLLLAYIVATGILLSLVILR